MSSEIKVSKPSKGRPKKDRVPVENPKKTDLRFMSHKARAIVKAKAMQLYEECGVKGKVATELGLPESTVHRWIKEAGAAAPIITTPEEEAEFNGEPEEELTEEEAITVEADAELIANMSPQEKNDIIRIAQILAKEQEMTLIETTAEGEGTPQGTYQSYVANLGMQILRDNKSAIRGPRTVKELGELDNIIRRNLGLDAKGGGKGGGGGSPLFVDVKILNGGPLPASEIQKQATTVDVEVRDVDS